MKILNIIIFNILFKTRKFILMAFLKHETVHAWKNSHENLSNENKVASILRHEKHFNLLKWCILLRILFCELLRIISIFTFPDPPQRQTRSQSMPMFIWYLFSNIVIYFFMFFINYSFEHYILFKTFFHKINNYGTLF